ncbi:MAG: DNA-protecting protein DprA, partial [Lysobacterales bacterium]
HALIRDGARLVENVGDVCDGLAPMAAELAADIREKLGASRLEDAESVEGQPERELISSGDKHSPRPEASAPVDVILEAIGFDPIALESLLGALDLDTSAVSARLMTLELAGFVEALPGARYVRLR